MHIHPHTDHTQAHTDTHSAHTHMHVHTRTHTGTHTRTHTTGWRRLIGSPKLQILFHNRATKYRSRLRKMTYKDKGSYESLPPCAHLYSTSLPKCRYGVATISRLLKIKGLFGKRALQKRPIFSKETCNFKEPTNRSHPISSDEEAFNKFVREKYTHAHPHPNTETLTPSTHKHIHTHTHTHAHILCFGKNVAKLG